MSSSGQTATTATAVSANTTTPTTTTTTANPVPGAAALVSAARLGIEQDKPIQLDYYVNSAQGKAFLGEDPETKERVLIKSKEEFTSLVQKIYKVEDEVLVLTENSIYIVSGKIQKRKINLAALHASEE